MDEAPTRDLIRAMAAEVVTAQVALEMAWMT